MKLLTLRQLLPVFVILQCVSLKAQYVIPDDEAAALQLAKKYKDESVICMNSYQLFSFDKRKKCIKPESGNYRGRWSN